MPRSPEVLDDLPANAARRSMSNSEPTTYNQAAKPQFLKHAPGVSGWVTQIRDKGHRLVAISLDILIGIDAKVVRATKEIV